jgi:hypothetical protein
VIAFGASVRGAAHRRLGTPNQDALRVHTTPDHTILAVADGHGSERCFRSDVGSRLAVGVAVRALASALGAGERLSDLEVVRRITQRIVGDWTRAVHADLRLFPLAEHEQTRTQQPLLPYGSTLCAVTVTSTCILYLQLGDGDVLAVSEHGRVRRPLPPDDRLIANHTTSLCSPRAADEFRVGFQLLTEETPPPALILVSTDGYANSFKDERGFLRVGPDMLQMLRTEGVEPVRDCLPVWLEEASRLGSGDDVTLGQLYREAEIGGIESR